MSKGVRSSQRQEVQGTRQLCTHNCARWTSIRELSATRWPRPSVSHRVETLAGQEGLQDLGATQLQALGIAVCLLKSPES